jgi:ribosomal protein S18 acetylase RimI-like enzyme
MDVLAQILGFIAFLLYAISLQQNDKKKLLLIQIFTNILFGLQYLLLDAMSAAGMNIIYLASCILFYYQGNKKPSKAQLFMFIAAIFLIGILTYNNHFYSLIPVIPAFICIYTLWQNNMTIVRVGALISGLSYILYNIIVGAYAVILMNIISSITVIIAIIRFDFKKMLFILRDAQANDLEMLIDFNMQTILESDNDHKIDEKELKKITKYVKTNTEKHLYEYKTIMIDNNIVGSVLIYPYEDGVMLDEIYLKKKFRSHGIGTSIIKSIINSNPTVYLWVYKNNDPAISIYKKLNFKIIAETDTRYQMKHE